MSDDDGLFLDDDGAPEPEAPGPAPWTVVVADDEPDVHTVTELALAGSRFAGRPVRFVHAYSGAETVRVLRENPDAAVLLLDVVMESEHAGLEAAEAVRNDLGNRTVRIILRTGQPGMAPEREVIDRYEIDLYVEKTELTGRKLYTLMHSMLRAYRDIATIDQTRRYLQQMLEASGDLFRVQSFQAFSSAALGQIQAMAEFGAGSVYATGEDGTAGRGAPPAGQAIAMRSAPDRVEVIAGTGAFAEAVGRRLHEVLPADRAAAVAAMLGTDDARALSGGYALSYGSAVGRDKVLYIDAWSPGGGVEEDLLRIFSRNVGIAFDNLHLKEAVELTQREMAYRLCEAMEFRSRETGNHVRRVARMAERLALAAGVPPVQASLIKAAAPLHDIGKVAIPDAILDKAGPLTAEERAIMETHTLIGHRILDDSRAEVLRVAARIALQHHERWDGDGYPHGLAGADIDEAARIVGLVDVVDALGSDRPYKRAWPAERIRQLIEDETGRAFDPRLAALLLAEFDAYLAVREALPDTETPRPGDLMDEVAPATRAAC